ncbi:MAG: DEAD/DEAH box helicase family protein [Candidatus Omnitrophica bacterium]|nr:DEAD/DEAH box helicase family protein [Candidatus Omnitrophota bacterium]
MTNSGSGVIGVNEIKTLQNQIGVKATGSFDDQTYNALITNIDNLGTTAGADKTVIAGTAFTMFMSETQQNKYAETINTFSANMPEKKIMSSSTEINSNGTKGTLTTSAEGVKFVGEKYAFQQGLVATNATIVFKEGKITQAQGSVYVSKGLTTDVNGQSLTIDNVKGTKDGYLGQLSVEGSGLVSVTVDQSAKIQVVSEDKKNNWIIQGSYKGVNAVFAITDKGLALKQGVYTASAGYIAGNKDNVAGATSQQQNKIESTNITDIVIEGNAKDGYAYTGTVEVRDFKALIFNTQGAKLTVGTNGVQFGEYTYNKGSELIGDKQGQLIAQTGAGTMNVTIGGTKATADFFVKETGIKTLTKLQGDLTTTKPVSLKNEYAGTDTYKAGSNLVLLNGELAIMGSGIRTIKANDLDASVNFKTDSITGNMTFSNLTGKTNATVDIGKTNKGLLQQAVSLSLADGKLNFTSESWKLDGTKVVLGNFRDSGFELKGKQYTFDFDKVNNKYIFTPFSRTTYDTSKTEDKQFLQNQKFNDVTGKAVTINTEQSKQVTFVYDISGKLSALEGGLIKVDGMQSGEVIVDEFGGLAVDNGFSAKGVVLTLESTNGAKTDLLLLNGNSVLSPKGVFTIESGQAVTLGDFNTGLKSQSKDSAVLLHISGLNGQGTGGTESSKNVIDVDIVNGELVVQKYQTINLENTAQGTQFVLKENDYLNNLNQDNSIAIVDVNNKQINVAADMQVHITLGSVETHSNGEIVDKNSYIGRAWNSLVDAKTWASTEEVNGNYRIINKVAGAGKAFAGMVGTALDTIVTSAWNYSVPKAIYNMVAPENSEIQDANVSDAPIELWIEGVNQMFNAGDLSRSATEISAWEMLGGAVAAPAAIGAAVGVALTGGAAISLVGAGSAAVSAAVTTGLQTMAWSVGICSATMVASKVVDLGMEQGWSLATFTTSEALWDIAGALGEGVKVGIYTGLLSMGISLTTASLTASLSETGIAAFSGTSKFATFVSKLGSPTGMFMLSSGLNVASFGAGFHVFGKALNSGMNLTGFSDSDAFLANSIRGMGQGTVEQSIVTGFAFGLIMGAPVMSQAMKVVEGFSAKAGNFISNNVQRGIRPVLAKSQTLSSFTNAVTAKGSAFAIRAYQAGTAFGVINAGGQAIQIARDNPDDFWSMDTLKSVGKQFGVGFGLGFAYAGITAGGKSLLKTFYNEFGSTTSTLLKSGGEKFKSLLSRTAQEITVEQTASSILQGAGVPQGLAEVIVEFLPGGSGGINISVYNSDSTGAIIANNKSNYGLRTALGEANIEQLAKVIPDFETKMDNLKVAFNIDDTIADSFNGKTLNQVTDIIVSRLSTSGSQNLERDVSITVANTLGVTVGAFTKAMQSQNADYDFDSSFETHNIELGTAVICEGMSIGKVSESRGLDTNYMSDNMTVSQVKEVLGETKSQELGLNDITNPNDLRLADVASQLKTENLIKVRVNLNQTSLRQYGIATKTSDIKQYAQERNLKIAPAIVGINMNSLTYFRATGVTVQEGIKLYNLDSAQGIDLIRTKIKQNSPAMFAKILTVETVQSLESMTDLESTAVVSQNIDDLVLAAGVSNAEELLYGANLTVKDLVALNANDTEQLSGFEQEFNVRISTADNILVAEQFDDPNLQETIQNMFNGQETINLRIFDSSNNIILEFENATRITVSPQEGFTKLEVTMGSVTTEYKIQHNAKTNEFKVIDSVVNVDGKSFKIQAIKENGNTFYRVDETSEDPHQVEQAKQINAIVQKLETVQTKNPANPWKLMERNGVNQLSKAIQLAFDKNTLWEIPAGTGKTFGIFYLASALANQVSGKKVIFVLHNAPLYNDIVNKYENDGELQKFYKTLNAGAGMLAMPFTQESLTTLQRGGQGAEVVKDQINKAGVVFMQADTWGFFALGAQQSAKTDPNAQVISDSFTEMFTNSKIIHDEVDTAFSKNRFQQGLNPRSLTPEEIEAANFVDNSLRNQEIFGVVIGKGEVGSDTKLKAANRLESERNFLMFKLQNRFDSKIIIPSISYADREAMDGKHNYEIIGIEFNQGAKQAIVNSLENSGKGLEGKIELNDGDIVAKAGVTLTDTQQTFLNNVKASMSGRAKVLRMYEGQDSGYDRNGSGQAGRDDKFLVKPFANMSLASSLQVGDPFIAAHSEIVFKDLLLSEIHEKATPEEKEQKAWNPLLHKVGVSGRAKVTAMNRAITMAMNMGADFSGFSGTVSSITQQAMAFYGVSSSLHNEGNIVSRMFNQSVNVQQKNSFESAMDGIIFEEGRVVTILNGLGGTDESSAKAEVIARAQKAEYTIIVKDQDTAWTVYTKADANSTEADASGYIVEENVPTEKIESYLETDKKANEGVLFYYNQSACRGTDTKLSSEEAKMIDRVGQKTGKVQVHAFFNAETTKTVAEQLLKRDRGLRLSVVETKNTNGDVIGYEVDTVKGNYQYMYRNIDTGEIVTEVMANNWADQESQRTGKTIKREAMFTEAFNDLTVNFIGASVKNTPDLLQIESGLAAQNNVSEEKAKEIVREFTPSTSLDIINTRLTEEVGPVESKLIIEKAQLQTLFVQNDVKAQKKMLLNGLMEIYDSVVTSHLEQLRDSDINIEEVKFIENLIIDFNNQTGVDTNIKMQNSAQSGVEALQKKIDGIIEFFQGKLENGSLEENLSSENYQQIQNIVTKTPALTFNADSIARKPKAIALSSTLAEAIISTNYYIQASQMPEIAPLSGESAVNIPAENWSEAAQSIEQQASDVAVNKIKDTLESKGHLVNGRLTQGGVLFINYLKQFMNASENMQTAVVEMAQGVGTEKVKAVDLPDDLVNKLAKALFALVGADIISLNVTSKSSAKKLMNTITGLQAFSGVIDLKEISTEDYQQALNSTDSTAIANLVLSNLGKDQNSDLFNSINVVAKKQDAINNNIDKLQRKIKYLQTRENQLYANYLGVSNQKTSETKTDSKDNILVRAYNNVSGSVSRTAKRAGIKFQLWSAHKQSEKAVQDLSAARINKIQTPVTVQDLTTVARQLGDTKLENVGSLALLFNSGMDTNNLDKANSTVAVFADMGMSSSIETLSFNNLIDFSTIDTETRGNIINGLVGESNVASFNEDLKTFKGDLLNSYQSDISANLISSIDKVKANFITGKEDSHLKLINWMAGSDFNQSAYYMAQASINSDMSETGAISDYKKVLDVKSDATLVQKAQASYSLGLIYFAQSENDTNSYDKAITNLENAAKYAAEDNQLTGLAADVYVKIGDINTEKAQQGIKSEGSNVSDSLSLAKTSYEKALELNAESIGAYFGLGRIDLVQSNYLDAQENFEACISLDKGQANHANMIGVAKALLNQTINAISIPDIAQVIDVNIGLAKKNIEAKEYGKAVDNYKKVLSLAKKMEQLGVESSELDAFVVGTNKDLAQVFKMKISQTESPREQQLIAEAIVDCYKAALEKDQQDPQLHYDLGIVYKAQGNVSKAKEAFQSADKLARSPDIKKAANVELEKINDMETFKQKADNVIADLDLAVTDLNNGYLENAKQGFEAVIEKSKSDSSLSGMIVGKLATTGENLISAKQFDKAILAFAMVDKAADNIAQDSSLVKDKISLKENIVLKQQTAKFGSVMQKVGEGVKNFDDGLYQEAADAFQQSIENAGNVTDNSGLQYVVAAAYFNRALSLLQTDDKDKATKAFDEFKQVVEDNNLQSSAALANGLITSNDITALIKVDDILANVNQNDERKGDQMGKAFAIDVDGRSFQIPVIGEKKGDNLEMSSMWEKDGSKISIPITGQLIGKDLNKSLQNIKTAALNLPEDQKIIVEAIIGFAEAKGINFLAANAADVMGFANGKGEIFVSEKLIDNKNSLVGSMAVFHEAGEAYFNANPELLPVGVSSHTYLRGCGKDVRNAMPKAIDSLAKKLEGQNRSAKPNEIVAEINSLLSGDKRVTSSEMALIDDNFLKGKNIQDWDKGLGDAVSSHGMIQLSDALINIKQDNLNEFSRADISSDKLPNPKLDKELLKTIDVDPSLKSMETFMMLDDLLNGKLVNEKKGVNTMLNSVQQFQKAAEML